MARELDVKPWLFPKRVIRYRVLPFYSDVLRVSSLLQDVPPPCRGGRGTLVPIPDP